MGQSFLSSTVIAAGARRRKNKEQNQDETKHRVISDSQKPKPCKPAEY